VEVAVADEHRILQDHLLPEVAAAVAEQVLIQTASVEVAAVVKATDYLRQTVVLT
jgi:hypothetical protein